MNDDFLRDNVARLLAGEKDVPAGEFLSALERRLRAPSAPGRSRSFPSWQAAMAAVVLLGLAGLLFFPAGRRHTLSRGSLRLADGRTVVAPASFQASLPFELTTLEESVLELSEGVRVRLDKAARMELKSGEPAMKKAVLIALLAGSASCTNEKGTQDVSAGQTVRVEISEAPRLVSGPQEELTAKEVVERLERKTKKKFFYSEDLGLGRYKVKGAMADEDPDRVYETGLSLLKSVQIAALPQDDDGKVLLTHAAIAGKSTVKVYTSAADLPKADEFCCLSLKLKHASPRDLQAVLINKMSFPQHCVSMESTRTLVLSDYASNLRGMAEIARQLDAPAANYHVALTILEGRNDPEAGVPAEFRKLDLPSLIQRNRFAVLGEFSARIDGAPASKPAPTVLHLTGTTALVIELTGTAGTDAGVVMDPFIVRPDGPDPKAAPLLQTRVDLREGVWRILGSVPSKKEGAVLILVARATKEKEH